MKKILSILFIAAVCTLCVFAQGGNEKGSAADDGLKGKITVASNATELQYEAMQTLVDKFMEENPGVDVEFISYSKDYENLMKAKMAANDLPDVFATHGWSVKRYAEYLLPLNDLDFVDNIAPASKDILSTETGDVLTVPMNIEQTGIIYNKDILEKAGWDSVPRTFDEFLECCEDVKALGVIPVYITGKDTRSQANLMDLIAPSMLIATKDDFSESLYDGSFDWSNWERVSGFLYELKEKGYLNVDCNTADPIYTPEKLAFGEVMFAFSGMSIITNAQEINPDVNLSMMPIPAYLDTDEQILIGGERESYGIWKDSPNLEIAKMFIEFIARPENVKYFCETTGMPCAFTNVDVEVPLAEDFAAYQDLAILPYFDREWLPSGMWATMRSIGGGLTSNEISVKESCSIMEKSYNDLRAQL